MDKKTLGDLRDLMEEFYIGLVANMTVTTSILDSLDVPTKKRVKKALGAALIKTQKDTSHSKRFRRRVVKRLRKVRRRL